MEEQPTPPPESNPAQPQPAAYDTEGRPLYYAPPEYRAQPGPQFVHMSRAVDPAKQEVSDEIKAKHDASMAAYPFLNMSDAEYIISAVRRHSIGLVVPVALTIFLIALIASCLINYSAIVAAMGIATPPDFGAVAFVGVALMLLVALGGYIAYWVYTANKFFLTNESVIQEIQFGLFKHHEQTVSLANIEDASYDQHGIIQMLFNYGSIRLSTEGEETTYRFSFVANPKEQIATLNNAVEAFKNGRPV
jgi:uncharacterized membrane protein YdbT with pleckstrin-like domain